MTTLYTSYYTDRDPTRQAELDECLYRNIQCKQSDQIVLLIDDATECKFSGHSKLVSVYIKSRPTFNMFFDVIRQFSGVSDVNIIANSDIYFDETLSLFDKYDRTVRPTVLALCRWDVESYDRASFLNRPDSQDSWIFRGKPFEIDGNFRLGEAGCDNAIADRFERAGYRVINPSRSVKTYHMHKSGVRYYDVNKKVPQPYKVIHPSA